MCDKPVDTHPSTKRFVTKCYKFQEMCDKAVKRCFFLFDSIPDQYNTRNMWHSCFYISF